MEEQLHAFRRYSRVFPSVSYGRHAARVGCSVATDVRSSALSPASKVHHSGSCVKILALLCSKNAGTGDAVSGTGSRKRTRDDNDDDVEDGKTEEVGNPVSDTSTSSPAVDTSAVHSGPDGTAVSSLGNVGEAQKNSSASAKSASVTGSAKGHVYVRVQYDRSLITTLPIEVMRKQHPQVLIDYLLAMSVWQ